MFKIIEKKKLTKEVNLFKVLVPDIARSHRPGSG